MAAPVVEGLPKPPDQQWTQEIVPLPEEMPCPFCGQPPFHVRHKHPSWAHRHQLLCMNKDCQTTCATTQQKSLPHAIAVWINRPKIQRIDVEELLAEVDKRDCFNA